MDPLKAGIPQNQENEAAGPPSEPTNPELISSAAAADGCAADLLALVGDVANSVQHSISRENSRTSSFVNEDAAAQRNAEATQQANTAQISKAEVSEAFLTAAGMWKNLVYPEIINNEITLISLDNVSHAKAAELQANNTINLHVGSELKVHPNSGFRDGQRINVIDAHGVRREVTVRHMNDKEISFLSGIITKFIQQRREKEAKGKKEEAQRVVATHAHKPHISPTTTASSRKRKRDDDKDQLQGPSHGEDVKAEERKRVEKANAEVAHVHEHDEQKTTEIVRKKAKIERKENEQYSNTVLEQHTIRRIPRNTFQRFRTRG